MRHYYVAGLLALGLPLAARAQATFQPGYVVQPAGDTLRGEVEYRDAYLNGTQCRFRPAAGAEARTYRPAELRAYGVPGEGRAYRSLRRPGPGAAAEPVFAEVLVSGPATLYTVRDADRADHFYLEAPQFALTELTRQRVLLPGRTDYVDQPVYRTTLAQALPNCPAAERQLPQLPLSAPALARVVRAFNQCRGASAAAVAAPATPARQRLRLGAVLGVQVVQANLTFPGSTPNQRVSPGLPTTTAPVLGAHLSVPLGALSRRLSLETSLFYSHQHYSFTTTDNTLGNQRDDYDITLNYLRLPLLLRYTAGAGRLRPVLELGPTLNFAVTLDANVTNTYYSRTTTKPFYEPNQLRLQEGICGGLGLQMPYWATRRATLLVRYEADTGWTDGATLDTKARRFYALLALDLTR